MDTQRIEKFDPRRWIEHQCDEVRRAFASGASQVSLLVDDEVVSVISAPTVPTEGHREEIVKWWSAIDEKAKSNFRLEQALAVEYSRIAAGVEPDDHVV